MIQVTVSSPDAVAMANKLRKLGQKVLIFDNAMRSIGKDLTFYYGNYPFASQGGIYGDVWAPLSPKYALYKATGHTTTNRSRWRPSRALKFPGAGPLIRTGAMKKGFYYKSDRKSVMIGNKTAEGDDPYLIYHQEGTSRGLPARPIMKVNDEVLGTINDIITDDIRNKVRLAGL